MKHQHFEALRPLCPVCLSAEHENALQIARVISEEHGQIVEGVLHCTRRACQREYPILDGIPLILAELRAYVASNMVTLIRRRDLSGCIESILGDCCGPGSILETINQHLASYTWDHYGDLDPQEPPRSTEGSVLELQDAALRSVTEIVDGPLIDLGCSVGRTTFALAERYDRLTLGVDLNFSMLGLASRALRHKTVAYPRRRVGIAYDHREFPVELSGSEHVDFWICDAAALPFSAETYSLACLLNLLDCVSSPHGLLHSTRRVLRDGGQAVVSCPYDWSPGATPVEAWLGGHSQRGPGQGASEPVLRSLLDGSHPNSIPGFTLLNELDNLPWRVRLHDRSTMEYRVHVAIAQAVNASV